MMQFLYYIYSQVQRSGGIPMHAALIERDGYGVVIAAPWGCAPALVSEALLRHRREIPMLFFYHDGSPLDERRLASFVFRLRAAAPRA